MRDLLLAVLLLAAPLAEGQPRPVTYTTKAGESAEAIAREFYGNPAFAVIFLEANGLSPEAQLPAGRQVTIPTSFRYRVQEGETLAEISSRFLKDPRRASFLASWNGLGSSAPAAGTEIVIPYHLGHRAGRPETLEEISRRYYGEPLQAAMLAAYNFRSSTTMATGDGLIVPFVHLRLRAAHLAGGGDRFAARLRQAERAWGEGQYEEIPPLLVEGLAEERPSEAQLAATHRLLGFAYVAMGLEQAADRELRAWLALEPRPRLDPVAVSPKLRNAVERARRGR